NDEVEKLISIEIVPSQHLPDKAYLILLGKQGEMRMVHGQLTFFDAGVSQGNHLLQLLSGIIQWVHPPDAMAKAIECGRSER
ncbi:hypothetical protein Tco_0021282, partial [Tanacetum coccineum]